MPDNLGGGTEGNAGTRRRSRRRRVEPETFGAVESSVLLPKRPTPGSPSFGGLERPAGQLTGETLKQRRRRLAFEARQRVQEEFRIFEGGA